MINRKILKNHIAHLLDIGKKHGKSDDKLGARKLKLASYLLRPVVMKIECLVNNNNAIVMVVATILRISWIGPVGWVGSGDSDASPSGAKESDWKLRDVWQHLRRAVVKTKN